MFKQSAMELKNVRCITVTGILIAIGVVLNTFSFFETEILKMTFGYLAIATIGMLFGPVVAIIAAIPFDLLPAMFRGHGIIFWFTIPKMIEGLIYGIFLYGCYQPNLKKDGIVKTIWSFLRIGLSRVFVVTICYFFINSYLIFWIFSPPSSQGVPFMTWAWLRSGVKITTQFPIDLVLMFTILPIIKAIYNKINKRYIMRGTN